MKQLLSTDAPTREDGEIEKDTLLSGYKDHSTSVIYLKTSLEKDLKDLEMLKKIK